MAQIDINDPIWDGVRDRLIALGLIARNMLKDGLSKDFVSEITHLSAEEVDEIARLLDCGD